MSAESITLNPDRFSWRRVWMIFQLYYPALKKQMICFPLVSLALMWIGALYYRMGCDLEMSLLIPVTAASAMYYVAPIGIARRDFKPISALLLVTASEKMTFLLLYFGLFIAVEINLSIIISALIVLSSIPNGLSTLWGIMTGFGKHYPPVFLVISWGPALAILLCVLYTVVTVKRNRVFKGLSGLCGSPDFTDAGDGNNRLHRRNVRRLWISP